MLFSVGADVATSAAVVTTAADVAVVSAAVGTPTLKTLSKISEIILQNAMWICEYDENDDRHCYHAKLSEHPNSTQQMSRSLNTQASVHIRTNEHIDGQVQGRVEHRRSTLSLSSPLAYHCQAQRKIKLERIEDVFVEEDESRGYTDPHHNARVCPNCSRVIETSLTITTNTLSFPSFTHNAL